MTKKKKNSTEPTLFDVRVTTAPCVLAIRDKVGQWRESGYKGATDTTRRLLNHWFHTDHRLRNCGFSGTSNATCAARRNGPAQRGRCTSPTFTSCTKRRQRRPTNLTL